MAFQFYPEMSDTQINSLTDSVARINIWHGSVRSSKTIMSIVRWLEYVKTAPTGKLLMVGKTERTLKRNILDVIEEMVGKKNYHFSSGKGEVKIFNRTIDIVGANDERSENKIRGTTLAGAYGDELTLWPESFFKMLMTRLSVKGSMFFGTTNPDSPYHWLKEDYLDQEGVLAEDGKPKIDMRSFHFTLHDNPALDPDYIRALENEYSGLWYKRFIQGLWVMAEGVVYDMFNNEEHVKAEADLPVNVMEFDRYYVPIDYGTANPTVFLLIGERTNQQGERESYVLKEYYFDARKEQRQKTNAQYADDLVEFIGNTPVLHIYVDPSAKSFITELKQNEKITASVLEAVNDVVDGIREVGKKLQKKLLYVVEGCKNLLREFNAYVWDAKAQKAGEDKPMKDNDHALDALRYYVFTRLNGGEFAIW
jgi:PBSX family phage terminase large subunit